MKRIINHLLLIENDEEFKYVEQICRQIYSKAAMMSASWAIYPSDYVIAYLSVIIEHHCYGGQADEVTDKAKAKLPSNIDYSIKALYSAIPTKFISKLLPSYMARECRKYKDEMLQANKPKIELNEFSYELFKTYLSNLKTKLSGKEAIRFFSTLPNVYSSSMDGLILKYKFARLLWDHSNHTQELANLFAIADEQLSGITPVYSLTSTAIKSDNLIAATEFSPHVTMALHDYQWFASIFDLPTSSMFSTYTDSYDIQLTTGTPTPTLQKEHITILIDKLLVLNFIKHKYPQGNCPYIEMLMDQIRIILLDEHRQVGNRLVDLQQQLNYLKEFYE